MRQSGQVKGYSAFIYSGLPVSEQARILSLYVLPNPDLTGLYHVSGQPISKYELLTLLAEEYGKNTAVVPDSAIKADMTLDCSRFRKATGYVPHPWPELIKAMRNNKLLMEEISGQDELS
jgi:dTDP-4-dehydrorhamnose reductase